MHVDKVVRPHASAMNRLLDIVSPWSSSSSVVLALRQEKLSFNANIIYGFRHNKGKRKSPMFIQIKVLIWRLFRRKESGQDTLHFQGSRSVGLTGGGGRKKDVILLNREFLFFRKPNDRGMASNVNYLTFYSVFGQKDRFRMRPDQLSMLSLAILVHSLVVLRNEFFTHSRAVGDNNCSPDFLILRSGVACEYSSSDSHLKKRYRGEQQQQTDRLVWQLCQSVVFRPKNNIRISTTRPAVIHSHLHKFPSSLYLSLGGWARTKNGGPSSSSCVVFSEEKKPLPPTNW